MPAQQVPTDKITTTIDKHQQQQQHEDNNNGIIHNQHGKDDETHSLTSGAGGKPRNDEHNDAILLTMNATSTLQQRINASSSNGNINQTTNTATATSKSSIINDNSNNNNNSRPTTKLNGLKNRIIQRPPPLILDKVSNFYDNESNSINDPNRASSNSHQRSINCNRGIHKDDSTQANTTQTTAQCNKNPTSTKLDSEQINNQSNNSNSNIPSSANQKFWASLNENATRNKSLASARSSHITTSDDAPTKASTTVNSNVDSLGADLIISQRDSSGQLLTSRIVTSLSSRLKQQQQQNQEYECGHDPLTKDKSSSDECRQATNENNDLPIQALEDPKNLDVSNNSTEIDDICGSNDNGGGNLIGVDNPTPPAVDHHLSQSLVNEVPTSATGSRPRSNNPFIDDPNEDILQDHQSNDDSDNNQRHKSFHKRPASFIAATERVPLHTTKSSDRSTQKIVEEQFNELHLNDQASYQSHSRSDNMGNFKSLCGQDDGKSTYSNQQISTKPNVDQGDSAYPPHQGYLYSQTAMPSYAGSQYRSHVDQSDYGVGNGYTTKYPDQSISLDSESTICQPPPSATLQLPHWTEAIYELNYATLDISSVAGGAENGQFIYIIETGDIVLEIDRIKVSGFTLAEFIEIIDSSQFLLRAVQTKHSRGLTVDLKTFLNQSFPKNSQDKRLQNVIRDNIYRRTIPCTTRPPKAGEADKVDYHFISKEQFIELDKKGMLLECGMYSGHYYGTLRPFCDIDGLSIYGRVGQKEATEAMLRTWDANHPAVQMSIKEEVSSDIHPLYENYESLNMHQRKISRQISGPNNFERIANQNGLQLEEAPALGLPTQPSSIVAVDSEALPPGWERVIDQTHGTYYIDHNTQRTQYERPYEIELTKGSMGFGFTLVEADNGLLLVRSIIPGGPAHMNGMIRPGDILISAVGVSVAGLQHTDIARLFSTFAIGDRVRLTFARSTYVVDDNLVPDEYLFSNGTNGDLAIAVNPNNYYGNFSNQDLIMQDRQHQMLLQQQQQNLHTLMNQEFEFITVNLKRGDQGFGFTISDSTSGQKVRKIQNHEICSNLKQGDILTVLNGEDITKLTHKEVVDKLKCCPAGQDVTLTVKRKKRFRSKTPMAMHTDVATGDYSLDSTPQRNCKTPNFDGLMLRRPTNCHSSEPPVVRTLFSNRAQNSASAALTSGVPSNHNFLDCAINGLPHQSEAPVQDPTANPGQIYGVLPHSKAQPIIPQPIYGTHIPPPPSINHPEPLYSEQRQQLLSNLPMTAAEGYQLPQPIVNRPVPIHPSDDVRDNLTNNSAHASEASLPPRPPPINGPTSIDGLSRMNHYNNFMNNDKLVMMQMQQQQQPQHYTHSISHQSNTDYHQLLQPNSEISKSTDTVQPPIPAKPSMNDYLPNLYRMANNFQDNFYANREELSLQSQYESANNTNQFVPMNDQFVYHMPQSASSMLLPHMSSNQTPLDEQDEFEYHQVDLDRDSTDSNWGIRLIGGAEVERAISIGSIVFGGAASKNGKLKSGDEIISINGINVVGATHQRVVELISACANQASLVIRRKKFGEACEVVLTRNANEGFGFVIISSENCALIGRIIEGSPADRCQQLHVRDRIIAVNGRYITPNMRHPEIVNMIKDCGSTLRLRIIPIDCYTVELIKNSPNDNFGFSMRGGSEYDGTPLYILRVAPNGLARDLLNVGDQILEINDIPTVGMTHRQAATIIKHSDLIVKLKLRRNYVTPPSLLVDSPRALSKINQVTAEMKTVNPSATPTSNTMGSCDATSTISSNDQLGGQVVDYNGGLHPSSMSFPNMNFHQSHQPPPISEPHHHQSLSNEVEIAQQNPYGGNTQSLPLYAT